MGFVLATMLCHEHFKIIIGRQRLFSVCFKRMSVELPPMAVLLTVQLMLFSTLPFCSGEQHKILIIIMCFTVHIIV